MWIEYILIQFIRMDASVRKCILIAKIDNFDCFVVLSLICHQYFIFFWYTTYGKLFFEIIVSILKKNEHQTNKTAITNGNGYVRLRINSFINCLFVYNHTEFLIKIHSIHYNYIIYRNTKSIDEIRSTLKMLKWKNIFSSSFK